jgi:hypothetical protein
MREASGAHVALLTQDAEPATSAGSSGCSRASSSTTTWRSSTGPTAPPGCGCAGARMELERGSARSPRMASPQWSGCVCRSARCPRRSDGQARLLHRRQRLPGARGLGAGAVSRGSLRRGSRAGDRHAAGRLRQGVRSRRRPCCTRTTTRRFRSCAAASTSGAGCARSTAGASPLLAGSSAQGSCGERWGGRERELIGQGVPAGAPAHDARSGRRHHVMCVSPERCSARGPTCCRPSTAPLSLERRGGFAPAGSRYPSSRPHTGRLRRFPSDATRLEGRPQGAFSNRGVRRRIYLTYRYHGCARCLFRLITFPLRFTPLEHRCGCARTGATAKCGARGLVSRARPAGGHRHPELSRCRASVRHARAEHRADRAAGDGPHRSSPMTRAVPSTWRSCERIAGSRFSSPGAERRLRRQRQPRPARERRRGRDVVILNSDIEARGWLACLQYAAHR